MPCFRSIAANVQNAPIRTFIAILRGISRKSRPYTPQARLETHHLPPLSRPFRAPAADAVPCLWRKPRTDSDLIDDLRDFLWVAGRIGRDTPADLFIHNA